MTHDGATLWREEWTSGAADDERTRRGDAMYVNLLREALAEWANEPSDADLLEYVLDRRFEMLLTVPNLDANVYSALAAEVSYDRSLIKLSGAHGIETSSERFARPAEERRRLEDALYDDGVDLTNLARRRYC